MDKDVSFRRTSILISGCIEKLQLEVPFETEPSPLKARLKRFLASDPFTPS